MPVFVYVAKNREGKIQRGEVDASDSKDAVRLLRQQHLAITRLREKPSKPLGKKGRAFGGFFSRVKGSELGAFTSQWAMLIKAGISLLQTLVMLSRNSENPMLRAALTEIHRDIEGGSMLTVALRKHPKIFNDFYVSMVEVGESTGMLDDILTRLSIHIEKIAGLKSRIFSALAYPLTLIAIAAIVLAFMLAWVVPLFGQMFSEFGSALPWLTLMVIEFSLILKAYSLMIMVFFLVSLLGVRRFYKTPLGRRAVDRLLLALPLVGHVLRKSAVVQFARTLGDLVKSGIPILDGLAVAGRTSGNVIIEDAISEVRFRVGEGETVSGTLEKSRGLSFYGAADDCRG